MEQESRTKNYLNLDLVNVMYGVVASYGFYFIDKAVTPTDYIRFIFAYAVLFMDWVYAHHTYKGQDYKKSYLFLDLVTLFLFSRLLSTSTAGDSIFYFWLSIIFALYVIWDYIMRQDNINSGFNWKSCLTSDFIGAAVFFILWLVLKNNIFLQSYTFITIAAVAIYTVITLAWYRKPEKKQNITI
ncbi:MAG: hypothetical protein WCG99_03225 [Candidatus Berkelbacteria bacterium]